MYLQLRTYFQKILSNNNYLVVLALLFTIIAICTRLYAFIWNKPLDIMEAMLALNIINKPLISLVKPLDYNQGAPFGFLVIEKLMVSYFGPSEYVLRLFPLLAGVFSCIIFYKLIRNINNIETIPIAAALFASSEWLIYYSVYVKQYAIDVLCALIILLITVSIIKKGLLNIPSLITLSIFGVIVQWFSHPVIFVLGGSILAILAYCLSKENKKEIVYLLIPSFLWTINFAVCYYYFYQYLTGNPNLISFWTDYFMPLNPLLMAKWSFNKFLVIFENPIGNILPLVGVPILFFMIGCISTSENKPKAILLISPVILGWIASSLKKYPFGDRFLLFAVPALIIIISEGAITLKNSLKDKREYVWRLLLVMLFIYPVVSLFYDRRQSYNYCDIRTPLQYIHQNKKNEDIFYVYHNAQYTFRYYYRNYGIDESKVKIGIYGKNNWDKYSNDLAILRGHKRVWIIFSFVNKGEVDEEKLILYYLNKIGKMVDVYKNESNSVYLYDLTSV